MNECALISVDGWSGSWAYYNHIEDLAVGNKVVVESPGGQLKIGKVIELYPKRQQARRARKWIVDRIDMDKYNALRALQEADE